MATAFYAKKNNLLFRVFESTNEVGGNCRTIIVNDFKFDSGAHRLHDKIPNVTSDIKMLLID